MIILTIGLLLSTPVPPSSGAHFTAISHRNTQNKPDTRKTYSAAIYGDWQKTEASAWDDVKEKARCVTCVDYEISNQSITKKGGRTQISITIVWRE